MRTRWLSILTFLTWGVVLAPTLVWSQLSFGVGGDNVEAESSLTPFKIMLRGAINAPARDDSLGYLRLSIADYHATYDFDVLTAQAVDDARITAWAILQQYKNGKTNLILDGPKELLSKIGQARFVLADEGYERAFATILDANVTTLIVAIVLFSIGTEPWSIMLRRFIKSYVQCSSTSIARYRQCKILSTISECRGLGSTASVG